MCARGRWGAWEPEASRSSPRPVAVHRRSPAGELKGRWRRGGGRIGWMPGAGENGRRFGCQSAADNTARLLLITPRPNEHPPTPTSRRVGTRCLSRGRPSGGLPYLLPVAPRRVQHRAGGRRRRRWAPPKPCRNVPAIAPTPHSDHTFWRQRSLFLFSEGLRGVCAPHHRSPGWQRPWGWGGRPPHSLEYNQIGAFSWSFLAIFGSRPLED